MPPQCSPGSYGTWTMPYDYGNSIDPERANWMMERAVRRGGGWSPLQSKGAEAGAIRDRTSGFGT